MTFLMNLKNGPLWLALAGSVVFGVALVWHSLRRPQPFLDVRMLARNWPLTMTYLRAAAISIIVFSVYYGFAQWLQSAVGYLERRGRTSDAADVGRGGSRVADRRAHQGAARPVPYQRRRGARRQPGLAVRGRRKPAVDDRHGDHALRPVTLGTFSIATQAAVYIQAPAEEIGTAAGLQRTAQYIGAIAAASLLASIYGERASDHGLHSLAAVTGALSAILFIVTLFDRTIARVVSTRRR